MKRSLPWIAFAFVFACCALAPQLAAAHDPALDKPLPALADYLQLGVEHILIGFDHLAFLLGLALLAPSRRALLGAVSGFTVAHSLSLALCVLDVVTPPARWVEVAIALSIVYVALENWRGQSARRCIALSLGFGFVHGFGFAGALQEIGVPVARAPAALALFNVGVELGQLGVLFALLPALTWLARRASWSRIALGLHGSLAALGLMWAAERAFAPSESPGLVLAPDVPPSTQQLTAAGELCEHALRHSERGRLLVPACTRALAAALARGTIGRDESAQRACTHSAHAADSCSAVLRGQLPDDAACRSTLECQPGSYCRGVTPLDAGQCTSRHGAALSCQTGGDALASYLRSAAVSGPCTAQLSMR